MRNYPVIVSFFIAWWGSSPQAAASANWVITKSELKYTIHHPVKAAQGTSTEAKGKGACEADKCEFLIAVPVKTFDSGNSNRDLHMIETVRGANFPMVVVKAWTTNPISPANKVRFDFEVQFAGKTASYQKVDFQNLSPEPQSIHLKGTIAIHLSDFGIVPPSLFTVAIKDEVPIEVDSYWEKTTEGKGTEKAD